MKKLISPNNKITKLYIANRGEIALRIQRTAQRLGIRCCIGISEADSQHSFAREAEETVIIGPAPAAQSYLAIDAVIEAAKRTGCDAVHPGYGFLSENHEFAERVLEAGLCWIGPSPESIRLMGSKVEGRARAKEAKVPTVPGTEGGLDDGELTAQSRKLGFPLIIKAVGGGGGRGMRIIRSLSELEDLLPRARSEALKNFGDSNIFLERFIEKPRHVEVQLLGDQHGTLLHLGTRDCSVQRRHQKLIEEAPAPFLSPTQRQAIHRAAIAVARSVGYYSTGTAEFLVDGDKFYFLEMNTRIQVEHPVTESITGLDLIEQQILVARGEPLALTQSKIKFSGHSIEFRINAEDPASGFSPTTGEIERLELPDSQEKSVRCDFGFKSGDTVSLFYDGLIGKIIVSAPSRHEAMVQSLSALSKFVCQGITTNQQFHRWIIRTKIFNVDGVDIAFVGREFAPDCLEDLAAADVVESSSESSQRLPPHCASIERVIFTPQKGNSKSIKEISIVRESDGTYVASTALLSKQGKKKSIQTASNSKNTAITMLIDRLSGRS